MKIGRALVLFVLSSLCALALVPAAQATQYGDDARCFPETGQCISGRFREFWEQSGGLPVFGYPIGPAQEVMQSDLSFVSYGPAIYLVQVFERARMELHPENAPPYDVLLGQLGTELVSSPERGPRTAGPGPKAGCRWFQFTGYNVCDQGRGVGFQTYWQTHGLLSPKLDADARSLALLGLPLTEATVEINPTDGRPYLTQWFERARMEWHPDLPAPYKVLLGLLGREQNRTFAPVQLPPQPVQYFWPKALPAGVSILPKHSVATDHGYILALGDTEGVAGYLSAGALAVTVLPEPLSGVDTPIAVHGQPGILHGVPYGQVAIWQEQGVRYSLSFTYGPLRDILGLTGDFEVVDRATWLQRIGSG